VKKIAGILIFSMSCLFMLCTIKDDNGNLVSPGPNGENGPTNQGSVTNPIILVTPDSAYVGIRETLSISITVMQDSALTRAYSGAIVFCTANRGWLSAETLVTDSKGRAVLKISDTTTSKLQITFTCANTTQSLSITVTNTPDLIQKLLTVMPNRALLKADGADSTTIQVSLKNENNNPVSGQCVQFITSAGLIVGAQTGCPGLGQVATDAQGIARATLTSANINDTAFITVFLVSDRTKTAQTRVVFKGVTILLTADSTNLKPGAVATINAFCVNASNNPVAYAPVFFTLGKDTASNISIMSRDSATGPDGNARCVIKGTRTGTDSISVHAAGATASIKMNVTNLSLAVSLDAKVLQANISLSTLLHVVFTTGSGSPVSNNPVILKRSYQTANGKDTSDILTATTNSQGQCAFAIIALPYECTMSLEVSASSGTDMASAATSVSFIETRNITINAVPTVIQADGTSQSTVTVQVKTVDNNPIVGDAINFTTTSGMVTASATTDANGRAIATITSDRRNTIATVKATLAKDPTVVKTVQVAFTGVTLAASANPTSISSSGKDSSVVTVTLLDAAKNPIVGEPIYFSKLQDSTVLSKADTVTNNTGVARCKVSGKGSGTDTLKIVAAGDSQKVAINYSSNYLAIDTVPGQSCIANGIDSTRILVSYFAGDKTTFIRNAAIAVSVTLGTLGNANNSVVFAKQFTLDSTQGGKLYFYVKNPGFANTATISAVATTAAPAEITTAAFSLYFRATKVRKIVLTGSPSVIATNGSKVNLTAVAFDSLGNRVSNERITFNLFSGPGGGEYLNPPTAITAADGSATTNLVSGTIPSMFHGVGVVASDISGIKSDSVLLTIAGPPYRVSIGVNLLEGQDFNDGTFGLPCAAIVTDINGNPVADGTQVTFSLQASGFVYMRLASQIKEDASGGAFACNVLIDTISDILPFRDFSNACNGSLPRGEDLNGDCIYDPGPQYIDINHDGIREFDWTNPVEPVYRCSDGTYKFADFNQDGKWDPIEPLANIVYLSTYDTLRSDSAYWKLYFKSPLPAADSVRLQVLAAMDAQYKAGANFIPKLGSYDFSWDGQPYSQPSPAVSITRTIQTVSGKAVNEIIYGQSNANRVEIMIWAESQGVVTEFPAEQVLPVVGGSASK
jgi:adhesin/invasin